MRVFVTGTGRCGTVCFRSACNHMTNYLAGHETRSGRLEYDDQRIEVNHQFSKCLLHLYRKYPDSKFVHLVRRPEDCIPSLARLNHGEVMRRYEQLMPSIMPTPDAGDVAWRYYYCEVELIRLQLEKIPAVQTCELRLETIKDHWRSFWDWIGAEGDFDASLAEWDIPKNTGKERGELDETE